MRFPETIANKTEFISPKALRDRLAVLAKQKGVTLKPPEVDKWVETATENAARVGRLMTDQQFVDYRVGRRLTAGDKVRYVGERREEKALNGRLTYRPHGQTGTIVKSLEGPSGFIIVTFFPDTPSELAADDLGEPALVQLEARVLPCGWPMLERLVSIGENVR